MNRSECEARLISFWNAMEQSTEHLSSQEFLAEHDFMFKRCIEHPENPYIIYDCAVALIQSKAPNTKRSVFLLYASHLHNVCAYVARIIPSDRLNMYQIAQQASNLCIPD